MLTKVSSKGQVVIPLSLREQLNLEDGDSLQVEIVGKMLVLKKVELKPLAGELRRHS